MQEFHFYMYHLRDIPPVTIAVLAERQGEKGEIIPNIAFDI